MTRSIDQAPQPDNPNSHQQHPGAHPERVPTTTGSTPAYPGFEPAPIDRRPNKFWTRNKKIGASVMAVVAAGGIVFGGVKAVDAATTQWANNAVENMTGVDPDSANYEGEADPAEMSIEQFESLSRVQQMDYAGKKLNRSMQADGELVIQKLEEAGWGDYNYFNRELVAPSFNNTPQQIWDQFTAGAAHVNELADSGNPSDINEAKKLATAIAEGNVYDTIVSRFADGGDNKLEVGIGHDDDLLPATTTGTYSGVESNGLGLISFKKESLAQSTYEQVRIVARLTKGTDDNSMRWVIVKVVALNQSGQ